MNPAVPTLMALTLLTSSARADEPPPTFPSNPSSTPARPSSPADLAARRAGDVAAEQARRRAELRALEERLKASTEARDRLSADVAEIRTDRAALNTALLDTTARVQAAEERVAATEARLDGAAERERDLRGSLAGRRDTIAAVLATLQRMGRRPPPILLARPDDILVAVRTSMLLGAALPELRDESARLAHDLAELVDLLRTVAAERDVRSGEVAALLADQARLAALIEARRARLTAAETGLSGERAQSESLSRESRSLKELVDRMEGEVASAERAASAARRAEETGARQARQRFAAAAFRDPARLAPRAPFAETRGQLPRPASGGVVRSFGDADGLGGVARGASIGTRAGATVSSPADGWVVFAGTFRSYGRLLILNAGSGYYLLFAGMDAISVEVGQFVLAGEPVGRMGDAASPAAALGAVEAEGPVLYVEFRKDGAPIDPGPWWAKSQGEKVRG